MPPLLSKSPAPLQAHEKTYYLKLCKLVVEVGRPVLQDVFDAIHPPANLPGVLSNPKVQNELRNLQTINVLYQSQIDILRRAASGSITSAEFDISLLIVLLRNICNIASSKSTVWKKQPLPTDKSQAADIVRIRLCRNDLYHRSNLAVTELDFEQKWDEMKDALIRLGGGTKYEEDIQNIKAGSVDPEMEKHYHNLLKSREEAEAQQADDINFIKTEIKEMKTELKDVKHAFKESETSVTINIKTKFKLFAAGAVTVGWFAGCTYFLNRYKDDPETIKGFTQGAIIPGTLAMGATVYAILRGSIIIKVKVTSLQALDYLWKSYAQGDMEQNLHKVIVTDELIQQAPHGTDSVGISVTMSEDEYRSARDTLLGDFRGNIKHHGSDQGEMVQNLPKVLVTDDLIQHSLHGTDSIVISVTMSEDEYKSAARDTLLGNYCSSIPSQGKRDSKNVEFPQKRMRTSEQSITKVVDLWNLPSHKSYCREEEMEETCAKEAMELIHVALHGTETSAAISAEDYYVKDRDIFMDDCHETEHDQIDDIDEETLTKKIAKRAAGDQTLLPVFFESSESFLNSLYKMITILLRNMPTKEAKKLLRMCKLFNKSRKFQDATQQFQCHFGADDNASDSKAHCTTMVPVASGRHCKKVDKFCCNEKLIRERFLGAVCAMIKGGNTRNELAKFTKEVKNLVALECDEAIMVLINDLIDDIFGSDMHALDKSVLYSVWLDEAKAPSADRGRKLKIVFKHKPQDCFKIPSFGPSSHPDDIDAASGTPNLGLEAPKDSDVCSFKLAYHNLALFQKQNQRTRKL